MNLQKVVIMSLRFIIMFTDIHTAHFPIFLGI